MAKTPRQMAKKERNIAAAQRRLDDLRILQQRAAEIRKLGGYFGTDHEVVRKYEDTIARQDAEHYVSFVLNKCRRISGIIRRWLGPRIDMDILHVERLIVEFLARPQNAVMKQNVSKWYVESFPKPLAKAA